MSLKSVNGVQQQHWLPCKIRIHAHTKIDDVSPSGWIDEAAFQAADTNGDGVQDPEEFLVALTHLK